MTQFLVGERVVLACPENPFLHGRPAVVQLLTDYGAVVSTGVGSGQWRALLSELVPCREPAPAPTSGGFTGDACGSCGSFSLIRDGKCAVCLNCGTTVGSCS